MTEQTKAVSISLEKSSDGSFLVVINDGEHRTAVGVVDSLDDKGRRRLVRTIKMQAVAIALALMSALERGTELVASMPARKTWRHETQKTKHAPEQVASNE